MRRTILNLGSLCIAAAGALYLSATPASAAETAGTCTAGSGATCDGPNCCANAETCWNDCSPQET
jgi:hypothetical protein